MKKSYAGEMFQAIHDELNECVDFVIIYKKDERDLGTPYRFSHTQFDGISAFRDVLEKSGIMKKISYTNCFMSIQEAIDAYEESKKNKEIEVKYFEFIKQTNN